MVTMLIAQNQTVESGSFMGDQLCSLKTAYLFVENCPNLSKVIMSVSPENQLHFLWQKFIDKYNIELIWDNWNAGDWPSRWNAWDRWRSSREINGIKFDVYKELYLRIHGCQRQNILCNSEVGLNKRNIYSYWYCGQEGNPEELPKEVDWFDDSLIYHSQRNPLRDVYISPHAKTQGNHVFTFEFWSELVHKLVDNDVSVTVGYDQEWFCNDLNNHPLFARYWGDHKQWMYQICSHKLVACGNTGTGWLAAACGTPMITMEPPNSNMADHRYRECGLKNIVEVVDTPNSQYVATKIIEQVKRKVVMTTGCYDILHAGHVRHLEKARSLGTKLIVALNSDSSVKLLKGDSRPINPQNQRKSVLEALRCVDEVRVFDGQNALELIEQIKPDILSCGYGYTENKIVGKELVESYGGKVVVTCKNDAKNEEPSTTKIVEKVREVNIIEICKLAAAYSCNPYEKLKLLAQELLSTKDLDGDIADLGSYKGGSAYVMKKLLPNKQLFLIDTWKGNPYDDPLCHHKKGEWEASIEDCMKLVGDANYLQGIFPCRASKDIGDKKFCFVYVDMDTYQATKDALEFFWPRLVSGGKLVIDDYNWEPCAGVSRAVDEFCQNNEITLGKKIVENLYTCILVKL